MIMLKEYPEHPHREHLTDDDWERLDCVFRDKDESVNITSEEIAAYEDWVFDEITSRLQTAIPSMVLQ
jgi:hypothetical protein